jgi:hypothetical protein
MIATKENAIPLAMLEEGRTVMRRGTNAFYARHGCWASCIVAFGVAWAYNWWILLAFCPIFWAERQLAAFQKRSWMLLAAFLLSLECLVTNFAEWGTAYPSEQEQASQILGYSPTKSPTAWLEYYLPQRAHISSELLIQFGPSRNQGNSRNLK